MVEDRNIMGDKQSTGQTLEKPDSFPIDGHTPTQNLETISKPSQFGNDSKSPIKDSVVDTILESIAPSFSKYHRTADECKSGPKGDILLFVLRSIGTV